MLLDIKGYFQFVTDTSIIFAAMQNIRKMAPAGGLDW
jgi:hypothetical protein